MMHAYVDISREPETRIAVREVKGEKPCRAIELGYCFTAYMSREQIEQLARLIAVELERP